MKYYIGTYDDCQIYNEKVGLNEGYKQSTIKWSTIDKHPIEDLWKIAKHSKYHSKNLTLVEELTDDWYPDVEI